MSAERLITSPLIISYLRALEIQHLSRAGGEEAASGWPRGRLPHPLRLFQGCGFLRLEVRGPAYEGPAPIPQSSSYCNGQRCESLRGTGI